MLRSWKHIRADTKHTLTENPRRGVAGTQQGLQLKRRNLLQSKGEQPSSFLQAPPLELLHSDFPLFHLNPSVRGNKHVCDICESNTSRGTLSAQCRQSSAAGKKKKTWSHWAIISPLSKRWLSLGFQAEVLFIFTIIYYHLMMARSRRGENKMCMFVPLKRNLKNLKNSPANAPQKTTQNAFEVSGEEQLLLNATVFWSNCSFSTQGTEVIKGYD